MYDSIFSALQALQEHFCRSIHYIRAVRCRLYTVLSLALNGLKVKVLGGRRFVGLL